MKLLKKRYKKYVGKVYDIGVTSKDHSYIVNGIAVHNSAGGCLISYLIGITKLDPLEYGLLFERFLNKGRVGYVRKQNIVKITLDNGRTLEFDENKELVLFRGGNKIIAKAKDFKVNDELLAY